MIGQILGLSIEAAHNINEKLYLQNENSAEHSRVVIGDYECT